MSMTGVQFLKLWESYHQKLKPAQQQKFLSHVLLPEILSFDKSLIIDVLPKQQKFALILSELNQIEVSAVGLDSEQEFSDTEDRFERPCIHGEISTTLCLICRDKAEEVRRIVYIASSGSRYHFARSCRALEAGQSAVDNRGGTRSEVQPTYEDLVKYSREPCSVCMRQRR